MEKKYQVIPYEIIDQIFEYVYVIIDHPSLSYYRLKPDKKRRQFPHVIINYVGHKTPFIDIPKNVLVLQCPESKYFWQFKKLGSLEIFNKYRYYCRVYNDEVASGNMVLIVEENKISVKKKEKMKKMDKIQMLMMEYDDDDDESWACSCPLCSPYMYRVDTDISLEEDEESPEPPLDIKSYHKRLKHNKIKRIRDRDETKK